MRTLSTIFTAGVNIRNALYDRRMLKVNRLARPVVSIGNISVGGSGKTPFVIALGEVLKQQGVSFDVLSRGYRRKSSAVALVDPQGSPEQFGDEPLLIARKLQAPVVVGADRYQAGLWAEKTWTPNSTCWTMAFNTAACTAILTLSCCPLLTCTIFRCLWDVCASRSRLCTGLTQR